MSSTVATTDIPALSRRMQRKEEIRRRIIEGALRVFVAQGMSATTVEDVLQAAGVSRATFYAHFDGKQDIARAIAADMWQRAASLYHDFALLPELTHVSVRNWLAGVCRVWQVHRDDMGVMLREMMPEISVDSSVRHQTLIASLIGDGRHWRHFPADEMRRRARLLIFQLERTMMAFHIEDWRDDQDALLNTLADIWMRTISTAD